MKKVFSILILILFVVLTYYSIRWKQLAVEKLLVDIQYLLDLNSDKSLIYRKVAINNSLGYYSESEKWLLEALDKNPLDKIAVGNLAIIYSQQQNWQKAQIYFASYFSLGGESKDVLFSYANMIEKTLGIKKSLPHYFNSIDKSNTENSSMLHKVFELLIVEKMYWQAVSLMFSYSYFEGREVKNLYEIHQLMNKKQQEFQASASELLSVTMDTLFIPIKLNIKNRYDFILLNGDQKYLTLSEDYINKYGIITSEKLPLDTQSKENWLYKVVLPEIYVAGKKIKNVEVMICNECESVVGQSLLTKVKIESKPFYQFFTHTISLLENNP